MLGARWSSERSGVTEDLRKEDLEVYTDGSGKEKKLGYVKPYINWKG